MLLLAYAFDITPHGTMHHFIVFVTEFWKVDLNNIPLVEKHARVLT